MRLIITREQEIEAANSYEQQLYALAFGVSEMHNLKYGQLMAAAKTLEEERKTANERIIHQLECNLSEAALEFAAAHKKMLLAWKKHTKAFKDAEKIRKVN